MRSINWVVIKQKLREDIVALPHFFRNPVRGMRALPHWEWPTILILQGIFAAACSMLANLLERDFLGVVAAIVLAPVTSYLMVSITGGFFYYVFTLFLKREVPFRQLYVQVLFASIPLLVVSTVAFLWPPLFLIGTAAGLALLYVGFVDCFHLPRKSVRNILLGLFAMHLLYWGFQQAQTSSKHKTMRQKATPESLDILEKELNKDE